MTLFSNKNKPSENTNCITRAILKQASAASVFGFTLLLTCQGAYALGNAAHPTAAKFDTIFESSEEKAQDYGDINQDDSHSTASILLRVAENDDEKATDYGDLNDDGSHQPPSTTIQIA